MLTRNRFCESDARYLHSFKIHFLCSISASSNRLEFLGVADEAVLNTVPLQNLNKYPFKEICTLPYRFLQEILPGALAKSGGGGGGGIKASP